MQSKEFNTSENEFNNGEPIISSKERLELENPTVTKLIELTKTLLRDVKKSKRDIEKSSGRWINESIIFRVGARVTLYGISNLVMSYIKSENELLDELRNICNLPKNGNDDYKKEEILYSRNMKSVFDEKKVSNYELTYTQKLIKLPYLLLDDVKTAKNDIEDSSGNWVSDSSIFRVGAMIVIEISPYIDLRKVDSEESFFDAIKSRFAI